MPVRCVCEVGAFMIVNEPAFCFPLDLGPATASLEFVTGVIHKNAVGSESAGEPLKVVV